MTGPKPAFKNPVSVLKNEQGVVMIAALLVLVLLTIIGIASTNTSNTEVLIAGHQVAYQQNFYRTEGAIVEAVALLDAEPDPKADPPSWLEPNLDAITETDIKNNLFWENGSGTVTPNVATLADTRFVVLSQGIARGQGYGSSLDLNKVAVHEYKIYGRCAPENKGTTILEIGYLKAF